MLVKRCGLLLAFVLLPFLPAQARVKPLAAKVAAGNPKIVAQVQSRAEQPLPRYKFIADMDGQFRIKDSNRDGFLSAAEIEADERSQSAAQAQAQNRALFGRLDFDRNGVISPAEFTRLIPQSPVASAAPMLGRMDSNRDRKISLVEHRTATLANFDALDADKDGIVYPAEMKALKR